MAKAPVTERVPDAVAVKVAPTVPTLRTESAQEPLSKLPPLSSKSCSPVLSEMSTVRVSPGGYPEPQSILLPCRWKYTVRSVDIIAALPIMTVPYTSGLLQLESISKLARCAQAAPNKRMHHAHGDITMIRETSARLILFMIFFQIWVWASPLGGPSNHPALHLPVHSTGAQTNRDLTTVLPLEDCL